ncbi:MAG: V-type ATP synthase subunit E [Clostridiales bacterium]|jgi:vacuolar-type H+-ATPase subunit E/Vma4|nr:V-type ATP synthase subunit E [Clostridiales bacterium]
MDRITNAILQGARAQAETIVAGARAKAAEILAEARGRARESSGAIAAEAAKQAEAIRLRGGSAAKMSSSRKLLAGRRASVERAVALAQIRLSALPETDPDAYLRLLSAMAKSAGASANAVVTVGGGDRAAAEMFESEGYTVRRAEYPAPGFILTDGDIEYNCVFPAIFEANREAAETAAAAALFGEGGGRP